VYSVCTVCVQCVYSVCTVCVQCVYLVYQCTAILGNLGKHVFPGTWNRALFRVFFMSGKTRLFRGIEETSKQWKPVGLTVGAGVEQVHFFVFGTLCRRRAECEGSTESGSQKRRRKRYALVESLGNLFGRKGRCSPYHNRTRLTSSARFLCSIAVLSQMVSRCCSLRHTDLSRRV